MKGHTRDMRRYSKLIYSKLWALSPRSFFGLILASLVLVAVPLVVPLLYGAESINQLSTQGRQIVYQTEQIERYSKALENQLEKMERSIKLSGVLNDSTLIESYYQSHGKFREALSALRALPWDNRQAGLLDEAAAADSELFERIKRLAAARGKLPVEFTDLRGAVAAFLSQRDVAIERQRDAMQAMADDASGITIWLVMLMIPFAVLLAVSVARLITAPIRQINKAIQAMGSGELSQPVEVDGPRDLRQLGEKLEWLRVSLQELEKQKSTFLQHVSHELKTPLTSIREGAGLLNEGIVGRLTEKQQEVVKILYANSIQLQKHIEDLLNFNALQTGKSVLAKQRVQVRNVIESVILDHRLALASKALQIDFVCDGVEIDADEQKLRIIVDNLLSNAIKYSMPGGIIEIRAAECDGGISIEVADAGQGIAVADKDKIFDAFYQGCPPLQAGAVKGTGLGLAIVREYVLAHGGRVQLVDQPQGARFRVFLPTASQGSMA